MVDRMISPFTLTAGPILFVLSLALIRDDKSVVNIITALCIYFMWVLVSRTVRMLPHFYRCPGVPYLIHLANSCLLCIESVPNEQCNHEVCNVGPRPPSALRCLVAGAELVNIQDCA